MNRGKYVVSQVMEFFQRLVFDKAVKEYGGDFLANNLNSYCSIPYEEQFLYSSFAQSSPGLLDSHKDSFTFCISRHRINNLSNPRGTRLVPSKLSFLTQYAQMQNNDISPFRLVDL